MRQDIPTLAQKTSGSKDEMHGFVPMSHLTSLLGIFDNLPYLVAVSQTNQKNKS